MLPVYVHVPTSLHGCLQTVTLSKAPCKFLETVPLHQSNMEHTLLDLGRQTQISDTTHIITAFKFLV